MLWDLSFRSIHLRGDGIAARPESTNLWEESRYIPIPGMLYSKQYLIVQARLKEEIIESVSFRIIY